MHAELNIDLAAMYIIDYYYYYQLRNCPKATF